MRPVIAEVLEGLPFLNESLRWNARSRRPAERTWPVVKYLRRNRFDLAVLLTNSFHSAAVAWLSGAKRRVGYRRDGRGLLLTDRLEPLREGRRFVPSPVIDYYMKLAEYLGCPRQTHRMDLRTAVADEQAADTLWRGTGFRGRRVVVLNPGAAFGGSKCWPAAHFGELARRLGNLPDTGVLVLCGPEERRVAREIVKRAGRNSVQSLADADVSIGLSKECVRRADLMVTTDSGPRHFAAAFDVPVITLFGPTHIEWTETYFSKAVHMQKKVPCGPCQLRECPLDHRCMKELNVDEVYEQAVELLKRFKDRRQVA